MKTIVITSQKGGSGKTMLAAHLAVEAERTGDAPAWIIDTDRQATLTRWHERRQADTPQRGDVRPEKLMTGLAPLSGQGAAFCFIDTAPTISEQTAALIDLADLVVIPVRPSPSDLWAVTETVQLKDADKAVSLCHHTGQATGHNYGAGNRRPLRTWTGSEVFHC